MPNVTKSLLERRAAPVKKMQDLVDRAKLEKRSFTAEERREFDEADKLQQELKIAADEAHKIETLAGVDLGDPTRRQEPPNGQSSRSGQGNFRYLDGVGRECRSIAPGESFVDRVQRPSGEGLADPDHLSLRPGDLGEIVASRINGHQLEQRLAMQVVGGDSQGGFLVTPLLSAAFIDLARSASVVTRAGAQSVPVEGSELLINQLASDPNAVWKREGESATASNVTLSQIVLRPKTLVCLIPVSVELMEDSTNVASTLETVIGEHMGLALDQAALNGNGTNGEPLGIQNTQGISTTGSLGTPSNYDELVDAVNLIMTANFPGEPSGLSWIANPRDFQTYAKLKTGITGDNTPLVAPEWIQQLRKFRTTSQAVSAGATTMILGDFSQVLFGVKPQGLRIEIFREGSAADADGVTRNAATDLTVWIRAYLRADIAIVRPAWFWTGTGVTNS